MLVLTPDQVIAGALQLSRADRARVARAILPTLDEPVEDQATVDAAWEAELARRDEALENGTADLMDGDEVIAQARARLRQRSGR